MRSDNEKPPDSNAWSGRREAGAGVGARYEITMTKVEVVLCMNR
jgi:hypothetical protein